MPRYHFKCKHCQKETVISSHDDNEINASLVNCTFCGHNKVTFEGYFASDEQILRELSDRIENIRDRMEALEEYSGIEVLTLSKPQLN